MLKVAVADLLIHEAHHIWITLGVVVEAHIAPRHYPLVEMLKVAGYALIVVQAVDEEEADRASMPIDVGGLHLERPSMSPHAGTDHVLFPLLEGALGLHVLA